MYDCLTITDNEKIQDVRFQCVVSKMKISRTVRFCSRLAHEGEPMRQTDRQTGTRLQQKGEQATNAREKIFFGCHPENPPSEEQPAVLFQVTILQQQSCKFSSSSA
jgi:hypothetical protein